MRAFLFSLFLLFGVSCYTPSKLVTPLPTPGHYLVLDAWTIREVMSTNGIVASYGNAVTDSKYVIPSEQWFLEQFPQIVMDFFKKVEVPPYIENSNDCENFSKFAVVAAYLHHARDTSRPRKTSIAVGEFHFKQWNGPHSVNFAIVESDGRLKILFFDAQYQKFIFPSKREIDSCYNWFL